MPPGSPLLPYGLVLWIDPSGYTALYWSDQWQKQHELTLGRVSLSVSGIPARGCSSWVGSSLRWVRSESDKWYNAEKVLLWSLGIITFIVFYFYRLTFQKIAFYLTALMHMTAQCGCVQTLNGLFLLLTLGAFHDRSTNGLHHHIFYFAETWLIGFFCAQQTILASSGP